MSAGSLDPMLCSLLGTLVLPLCNLFAVTLLAFYKQMEAASLLLFPSYFLCLFV